MKDQWYADDRDLIKWGGIIQLCNTTRIKYVVQVAYFRKSLWPMLHFDGKDVPILDVVTRHFRDIEDIKRLGEKAGLCIDVVRSEFSKNGREAYTEAVCQQIKKKPQRKIVFLDPDTGLAMNNAKEEHVKPQEVFSVWKSLAKGDYLVFYQHRPRLHDWRETRRAQFAEACKFKESMIKMWESSGGIKDVVFYYCER